MKGDAANIPAHAAAVNSVNNITLQTASEKR